MAKFPTASECEEAVETGRDPPDAYDPWLGLRLECLRLAVKFLPGRSSEETMALAMEFYAWVKEG